jgi:hypothetical protein
MKTLRKNKKRISSKKHNSKLINKRRTKMRGGAATSVTSRPPINLSRFSRFSSPDFRQSFSKKLEGIEIKDVIEQKEILTAKIIKEIMNDKHFNVVEGQKYYDKPFTVTQSGVRDYGERKFEIVELTNNFCQLKYTSTFGNEKPTVFVINPDILSVDKLQYLINNGKLEINNDMIINNKLGSHIQISENTIILKILETAEHYKTGDTKSDKDPDNKFISIYEDETISMIPYEENLKHIIDDETYLKDTFLINVQDINSEAKNISQICEDITWLKEIMKDLNEKDSGTITRLERFLKL